MTQENQLTQEQLNQQNNQLNREQGVTYSDSTEELNVGMGGDLQALLALQEMKEVVVHGKPLLINSAQIDNYLNSVDSAINTEEELGTLLEKQLSKQDVEKIFNQQLHRKLVGQQFQVSEIGDLTPEATEDLVLVVPKVKMTVDIVEQALESVATDDLTKYTTYLPPRNEAEKLNPIRCVTGNALRSFLNEMQDEEGGLNMDSQIRIYCGLLTNMPDDDPTKKYGLMQLRALMLYGDVVSNKNLRLALTKLIEEEEDSNV